MDECDAKEGTMMLFVHQEMTPSYQSSFPKIMGWYVSLDLFHESEGLGTKSQHMTEHSNDIMVDNFEAIMTPKARLSKGMVGRVQASVMAMPQAGRRHGICKGYSE